MNHLVSIIIPTYNQAQYLKQAIESVIAQTHSFWEAIVIDNYSVDDTNKVVSNFSDQRIRFISFRNNGIIAASRNIGIREARGDLIAFLDSDDFWDPDKLARCVLPFVRADTDLVCHDERLIGPENFCREIRYGPAKKTVYNLLLTCGNCLSTSAVVVKKNALLEVGLFGENPKIVSAEDYDLWLKLSRSGKKFTLIDELLGTARLHSENATQDVGEHTKATIQVQDEHFKKINKQNILNALRRRKAKARALYSGARRFQNQGNNGESLECFRKSLRCYPLFGLAYLGIFAFCIPFRIRTRLLRRYFSY